MAKSGYRAVLLMAISCLAACTFRPAPAIDCGKLRSLRIGMTPPDVRLLLGEPYLAGWPGTGWGPNAVVFDYSSPPGHKRDGALTIGGIELRVYFVDSKLTKAESLSLHVWKDQHDLFTLDKSGMSETKWFEGVYCPGARSR